MKRAAFLLTAVILACALSACGGPQQADQGANTPEPAASQPGGAPSAPEPAPSVPGAAQEDGTAGQNRILVAYFTYGENAPLADGVDASTSASIQYRDGELTGNTGLVAGMVADATGGELFSIKTAGQYPDNYNDTIDVGRTEKSDDVRPGLSTRLDSLEQYDTIFLGFPNWWGDMPMAVYSFLDEYDLGGKTIVPFVTSGGSGFSNTIRAIEGAEPDATVLEGLSIRDSRSAQAEDDVAEWLAGLGY